MFLKQFRVPVMAVVLIVAALPLSGYGKDDKVDILALQKDAWAKLLGPHVDIDVFRSLVTPDFMFISGRGKLYSLEQNIETLKPCSFHSFNIQAPQTRWLSPNAAVIVYHLFLDATCAGHKIPTDFEVSDVWVRRNGKWAVLLYGETEAAPLK